MGKSEIPILSRNEWIVLNAVFSLCEKTKNVTVSEVLEHLGPKMGWHVSTLKTIMERMVQKGALRSVIRGRTCFYEPVVPKEAVVKENLATVLDNMLEGAFGPLVAYLADRKGLERNEIALLEKMLEEKKKENRK